MTSMTLPPPPPSCLTCQQTHSFCCFVCYPLSKPHHLSSGDKGAAASLTTFSAVFTLPCNSFTTKQPQETQEYHNLSLPCLKSSVASHGANKSQTHKYPARLHVIQPVINPSIYLCLFISLL